MKTSTTRSTKRYLFIIGGAALAGGLLLGLLLPAVQAAPLWQEACPGYRTRLWVGARGAVTPGDPNNLRSSPAGTVIGQIPAGGEFDVLGGPSCVNNITWWRVRYQGRTGWTAEGRGSQHWLVALEEAEEGGGSTVVRLRGGSPPNTIAGLSSLGGGGYLSTLCMNAPGRVAVQHDTGQSLEHTYDPRSGSVYTFPTFPSGLSIRMVYFPAICVQAGYGSIDAMGLSPDEQNVVPRFSDAEGYRVIQLPLEAYRQPGRWRLIMFTPEHWEIFVDVPWPAEPFNIYDFTQNSATVLLGGFDAYERIKVVAFVMDGFGGDFELQADRDGYALFELPGGFPGPTAFIGEHGHFTINWMDTNGIGVRQGNESSWVSGEDLAQRLYEGYWGGGGGGGPAFVRNLYETSPRFYGDDVVAVQVRLHELGYDPGTVDGYYGPVTERAVIAFQQTNGLTVDGVVGPNTWGVLFSAAAR